MTTVAAINDEMIVIEIKEEGDPILDEVERLLSMLDEDSEPVIDVPDRMMMARNDNEVDPLHTEEFRLVQIEALFPQQIDLEEDNKDNIILIVS
jgi:hypothetical protein